MSSLLTNTSAMTALQSLTATQNSLNKTQNQISTGLRIGSAADGASYWSISEKMKSDSSALSAVSDALSMSSSLIDTMSSALESTLSVMNTIKAALVTAQQPGADLDKIQTDIKAQINQLKSIGNSAVFNKQNWLSTSSTQTVSLVSSYDATNGVSYITVDTSDTQLFSYDTSAKTYGSVGILGTVGTNYSSTSILTMDVSSATTGDLNNMLLDVDSVIDSITTAASTLGATKTSVALQKTFVQTMTDSLDAGVGSLVDADMNEASTRLQALQVQQQLGIQSLSIANQNSQMILKLFQ